MIGSVIQSLLINNKITPSEIRDLYSKSTDEYERKILSMTNRIAERYSLTYGDDYEVAKKDGQLVISFYKYYNYFDDDGVVRLFVTHSANINEYTITLDDGNSLIYINPIFVEKTLVEFYEN